MSSTSLFALFLLIGLACASLVPSQTGVDHKEAVEIALRDATNAYRAQNGLPAIGCDRTVQLVAQMHAYDAVLNPGAVTGSCNPHSWGSGFTGTPYTFKQCCYTSDHNNAKCMWDKGKELNANFPKNIYENAYGGPVTNADSILTAWKNSPGHNDVILNKGIWASINWVSLGAGVASATGATSGKAFLIFSDGADNAFQVMINGQTVNNCAAIATSPSATTSPASNVSASATTSPASNVSASATTSPASNASASATTSPASNVSASATTSPASNASASVTTSPASNTSASATTSPASNASASVTTSPASNTTPSTSAAVSPSNSRPAATTPSATKSPAQSVDKKTCLATCVDERKACGKQAKKDNRGDKKKKVKAIQKCIKKKRNCRRKCKN